MYGKEPNKSTLDSQFHCAVNCTSCTKNFNPVLSGVNVNDRKILDENRTETTYKKGEILFRENTFPAGLFCLNSGKVMITTSDSNGNRIVTNLLKEVSFVGVADFLSGLPYQSTCTALSDINVCMIRSKAVEDLISNNAVFARKLLTTLARDYRQSSKRLLDITKKNMNVRLADALLELLEVFGTDNQGYIDVYLKRSEIAQICNMNETNVIRHLSTLDKMGAIRLDAKKIQLLDKNILIRESCRDV